eukprot:gene3530-3799_t
MGFTCPNSTEVGAVRKAIAEGTITWHAAPFNPQYEMFDVGLLSFALDLTHSLDDAFNFAHKQMISLRDVPGLTRTAIPVLTSKGIKAVTGGVNGFSAPPGVPKTTPFIWRDEESGQQLFAMWHPGGYAGHVKDVHIDSWKDCITAEGFDHVLCASWRDDNAGPPEDLDELQEMFHITRRQWPGAKVVASTLDDYLGHLVAAVEEQSLQLPVVTGEIGDTWIHGVASDPARMADYRAVLRARDTCVHDPQCDSQSPAFFNFSRILVKVAEHTWGISFNQYFGDFSNFTNVWLHDHLKQGEEKHKGLAMSLESWRRQRKYIDWALEALPAEHPIVAAFAADKRSRQTHNTLSEEMLIASGAVAVLQEQASAPPNTPANVATDGGLLKLQRLYIGPDGKQQLGNDWAAAASPPQQPTDTAASAANPTVDIATAGSVAGAIKASETNSDGKAALYAISNGCAAVRAWLHLAIQSISSICRVNTAVPKSSDQMPPPAAAGAAVMSIMRKLLTVPGMQPQPQQHQSQSPVQVEASYLSTPCPDQQQQQQDTDMKHSFNAPEHKCRDTRKQKQLPPHSFDPSRPAFGELQYNVYNLRDYDFVWDNYAYLHPVWVGDFGKWNISASSNLSAVAKFKPGHGAVDEESWVMHKLGGHVKPQEGASLAVNLQIITNGSHSLHAVSKGVSVQSPGGTEQLLISTLDVPLVNVGKPIPFPNPCLGPDMKHGVSYNLINNIWGTNYAMWFPFTPEDANQALRFTIEAGPVAA